jgi:2,4-dienoyl-CoA reductase-like NADH-dependent reductase (Old Yellow Enzyme family)
MAPMTRARALQPGNIPSALMAAYYQQRASAGLIITEATQISPQGQGYSWTPGLHSAEQVEGWRLSTEAVHRAGGIIFSQLWHVGRMSYAGFHEMANLSRPLHSRPMLRYGLLMSRERTYGRLPSRGHLSMPIFSRLSLITGRPR